MVLVFCTSWLQIMLCELRNNLWIFISCDRIKCSAV